jgi:hypothetical protein
MTHTIQLNNFQINLDNGSIRTEPIHHINELNELVRVYSRNIITQLTFYFYNSQHKNYYLTLRNSGQDNKFVVEFFHYYNQHFERIDLTREEKVRDFTSVMDCLHNHIHLNRNLVPYIINPFYEHRTMTQN